MNDVTRCDLCDCRQSRSILGSGTARSMRSDGVIENVPLRKRQCLCCGLCRSGGEIVGDRIDRLYSEEYASSEQESEHFFYTAEGSISRSSAFCDWMISAIGQDKLESLDSLLEVGAGAGLLVDELHRRFPSLRITGVEPARKAVEIAQKHSRSVVAGTLGDLEQRSWDGIFSIAVLEHVPSPTRFLREIHSSLKPSGMLMLAQPTQDVQSIDVFYTDHLHHFTTHHLRQYARKCGFEELHADVGHPLMPNFSLHVWRAVAAPDSFEWQGPPVHSACEESAVRFLEDIHRLNRLLEFLESERRNVAAFGVGEVFMFLRAYSNVNDFPFICGLDDDVKKPQFSNLPFPVVSPNELSARNIDDVLLTMNRVHYDTAYARLENQDVRIHATLGGIDPPDLESGTQQRKAYTGPLKEVIQ